MSNIQITEGLTETQIQGIKFLVKHRKGIIGCKVGKGKTRIVVEYADIIHKVKERPINVLVITKKNLPDKFVEEVHKWGITSQDITWFVQTHHQFMSLDAVMVARSVPMDLIIIDEAHGFRNRKGKLAGNLKKLCNHQVKHHNAIVVPVTGTPYVNFDYDIWVLLNFIDPIKFSSFWDFVKQYFNTSISRHQNQQIDGIKDKEKFRKEMEEYIYVGDITNEFPEPNVVCINSSNETSEIYDMVADLRDRGFASSGDTFIDNAHHLAFITTTRKLGSFPYLVSPALGLGWKIQWILDNIKKMETPIVIGACFPSGFEKLKEELEKIIRKPVFILDSKHGDQQKTIQAFKKQGGILLCSVHVAEGFDLQEAKNIIVLDKHWTHKTNHQFLGRVLRKGLEHTVNVYELVDSQLGDAFVEDILLDKERFIRYMEILSLNAKQNN